ncbi:uncharacterized protein LOC123922735 [Trifolium pratense]|uniref:uncharacterized protein LOC123922735 n=1 Tax=Trifolium pratense TaxID=57577 RepID=UPI001E692ECA|nr:uncharacterized protein LOC123922735 [Trifolium pratense]
MKIISWNCQGLGNPRTVRALKQLIAKNKPDIIFLMETKLHNISPNFKNNFAVTYSIYSVDCIITEGNGKSGGLILLWNNCTCNIEIKDMNFNYIDMLVTNLSNSIQWRATGIYGYPQHQHKNLTCDLIKSLYNANYNSSWLLFGDLNLIISDTEKFRGNPIDNNITSLFRSTLTFCDLQDLGYKGDIFTWTNKQQNKHLIKARLDRFLANSAWKTSFPTHCNSHLLRYKSDHMPISLVFNTIAGQTTRPKGPKPIRYEQIWTRDPQHHQIVKDTWLSSRGDIKDKEQELDNILECEETWWKQRSRELWLQHGDKNTKYFHMKANIRRCKNKIEKITDSQGHTHQDEDGIEKVLVDHFKALYTKQDTERIFETIQVVADRLNEDMYQEMNREFTKEEVFQAIKDMKSLAAPGPDGLPALFYHTYWEIIGENITKMVLDVLNNKGDPSHLKFTHICLIPKINNPTSPSDFRPISLCNVTLKIITKTIANRIKTILPDIISPNQSAFIKGRLITDNTLIASEIFHYLSHTKRKAGFVGLKTDMAKAYDRIEWDFLEATLSIMGFPSTLVQTIMKASKGEVSTIYQIIQAYQNASGLLVNLTKSEMVFSKGVPNDIKQEVANILPMQIVDHFSKYLGMPIVQGRSKKQIFNFMKEKIWKKLKGWKEKNLSFAGRGTLIKAVAQAIPTYLMSSFLISKGVCDQLEQMICNFWWRSTTDQKKLHWLKWSKVCTHKKEGGLGFRNLGAFNEALLAKQGWRLITNPNSLVAQVLKAKYYPNEDFLKAKHKQSMSYTWRSIMQARWILIKGSYWSIGSGQDVNIWEDNWIQQKGNSHRGRPKPNNLNLQKVRELMDPDCNEWNEGIINQVFSPHEAHMITNIPIIDKTQPDILTWDGTQDGQYSVKSGYQAIKEWDNLQNASSSNNSQKIWNILWKLNVPPKHSHLLWRVIRNVIPVKGNLFKRGIRSDPLCPRCLNTTKTTYHVFLGCEWSKRAWFASPNSKPKHQPVHKLL